jgi:thioredoxin 1
MSAEIVVTKANYQKEVVESEQPVLLDFWAEWCNPCKMIAPHIDQLAEAYQGRMKVGKVNVDADPDLAAQFGIISIPTLVILKAGQVAAQKVGAFPKHEIEAFMKSNI